MRCKNVVSDVVAWHRVRPSWATLRELYRQLAFLMGSINDTLSVLGTLAALFGLTLSQSNTGLPTIPIEEAPFPVRLVVFLAFCAGIGWATGILVRLCQRLSRDIRVILIALLPMVMAGLVAGLADWLVSPRQNTVLPQEYLLTLLGAIFALRCMVENLKARRGALPSPAHVAERSIAPVAFVLAIAGILVFSLLGAR